MQFQNRSTSSTIHYRQAKLFSILLFNFINFVKPIFERMNYLFYELGKCSSANRGVITICAD